MILTLIGIIIAICFLLVIIIGAPFVPSRPADINKMIAACHIKKGDIFIDLGCGDGRVLRAAAGAGANVIGYEINPLLALIAKLRLVRFNSRIHLAPYQTASLSDAHFVYVFTAGPYLKSLTKLLQRELQKGSIIISYGFKLTSFGKATKIGGSYLYHFDGTGMPE